MSANAITPAAQPEVVLEITVLTVAAIRSSQRSPAGRFGSVLLRSNEPATRELVAHIVRKMFTRMAGCRMARR